jgi:hypothetical protein
MQVNAANEAMLGGGGVDGGNDHALNLNTILFAHLNILFLLYLTNLLIALFLKFKICVGMDVISSILIQ